MKLKVSQLMDGYMVLKKFALDKEVRLPTKLTHAIIRNLRIVEPEAVEFEKVRGNLLKDLGEFIEAKDGVDAHWENPDKLESVTSSINEYLTTEVDVNIHRVRLENAGDTFNPNDMLFLDWMFIVDDEGAK